MVQPIDQGAIIRSGMAIVPDYAAQQQQALLADLQRRQIAVQEREQGRLLAEAGRKFERQQAFQADIAALGANPSPDRIAGLMSRYPEFSEGLKRAWDAGSEEKRIRDMSQLGEVFSYLKSGNVDRAKAVLRQRIEAEKAAGLEPDEQPLLDLLEGGDPAAAGQVQAQVGMALAAAAGPDKFASAYGALVPDKTTFEKEYDFILSQTGDPEQAAAFVRNKADPVVPVTNQYGTSFYRTSDVAPPDTGGSTQATPSPVSATVEQMIPITLKSESNGRRYAPGGGLLTSPKGAKGEMQVMPGTITDPGFGVRPAQNNSADEIARVGRDYLGAMMKRYGNDPAKAWAAYNAGPDRVDKAIAGGGDWLAALPAETRKYVNRNLAALRKGSKQVKGPQRVMTRQQYAKLPSGTEYIAPDGTRRVKP